MVGQSAEELLQELLAVQARYIQAAIATHHVTSGSRGDIPWTGMPEHTAAKANARKTADARVMAVRRAT